MNLPNLFKEYCIFNRKILQFSWYSLITFKDFETTKFIIKIYQKHDGTIVGFIT